ncbi:MAG: BatD family protein [Candidatus Hydrothermarchaeales archaeon]
MKSSIVILIILLSLTPVSAELGFIRIWESSPGGNITSIAAVDYNRDRAIDEILAGSTDNKVYLIDKNGDLISTYISTGNFYAVEALDWARDVSSLSYRKNLPIAGSWDNFVYAFYPWRGVNYFSNSNLYWKYDAGEDVYSIRAIDLDGIGYDNYLMVGVGNHLTDAGKVVVLNMTGTKSWEFSTSCVPKTYSMVDLDHDGNMTEVVIGHCSTVDVRNNAGTAIWSYSTNETVSALYYADFDGDGEYDDVLAAAGSNLYAINNRGSLLWTFETNGAIHSITGFGRGYDLEYYLIGSGTKILAFTGSQNGSVLWSYETGITPTSHIRYDFDGDGKSDDIVITDGQKIYAYEFGAIYTPKLEITKSVSPQNATLGQNLEVELVLINKGFGSAEDVTIEDQIPDNLKLIKGETTWEINLLGQFKKKSIVYIINASKAGKYTLPSTRVTYSDRYGVQYNLESNEKTINISESKTSEESIDIQQSEISGSDNLNLTLLDNTINVSSNDNNTALTLTQANTSNNVTSLSTTAIQKETNKTSGSPQLSLVRSIYEKNIIIGENATVDIVIRNFGESPAVEIVCEETIPEEIEIQGIKPPCPDGLEPGKSEILTYTISAKPQKNKTFVVNFTPLVLTYKDPSTDQVLEVKSDTLTLLIVQETPGLKERLIKIIPLLAGISAVLMILYKKNKLGTKKIRIPSILGSLKNKIRGKSNVSPELGKRFMETYIRHYKGGEPPTYSEMSEELGVDYNEIEKITKTVKKKLKK